MMLELRFVFIVYCDVFLVVSQLRYLLFDVVTFFDDVRNKFYFGMFKVRMEITLQLGFIFACY